MYLVRASLFLQSCFGTGPAYASLDFSFHEQAVCLIYWSLTFAVIFNIYKVLWDVHLHRHHQFIDINPNEVFNEECNVPKFYGYYSLCK